jgi:pilus assembly protein Flp/PilA
VRAVVHLGFGGKSAAGHQKGTHMKAFMNRVRDFARSEDGPTATEYAVMLALIIVVCIAAITTLGTNANTKFTEVGTALA